MHDDQSKRHLSLGVVAGASILVVATGSAIAWWGFTTTRPSTPPVALQKSQPLQNQQPSAPIAASTPVTQKPEAKPTAAAIAKAPQLYWLKTSGTEIALTSSPVTVETPSDSNTALRIALEQLLAGSNSPTLTSTIPAHTKLRSVVVKSDGIHVDLSNEFTTGGGSTSMTGRVAQVLYTATSLKPEAPVWLSVEGKALETLGGEGLMLDQPMTRKSFEQNFPL
jgi:spore germination protein GerM